jgi:AcrR family transcriptional regulator
MAKNSRQRMVVSTASLIGSRGAAGTSLSDVLEASQAPRGSIYHHFPHGKSELVGEAMRWTNELVLAHQLACTARTPSGVLEHFVSLFRAAVVGSHCRAGCPIAGVVVDTYSNEDPLLEIGRAGFRAWTTLLTEQLTALGLPRARAKALATTTLASVEGALILCRAENSVAPLETVADQLRQLASSPRVRPARSSPKVRQHGTRGAASAANG